MLVSKIKWFNHQEICKSMNIKNGLKVLLKISVERWCECVVSTEMLVSVWCMYIIIIFNKELLPNLLVICIFINLQNISY